MGEGSHISWTDNTFNLWIGCTKVSAGCDNCYAEREQDLRYGRAKWGKGNDRYLVKKATREKPHQWEKQAIAENRRIKVFTASLSDVFDEEVPDQWRDDLFEIIRATPHLDWLVLTKRGTKRRHYLESIIVRGEETIPANIWWGSSVEDQATFDQRTPELLKLRSFVGDAILWLSIEPLIGSIDMSKVRHGSDEALPVYVDWVVVGGESGPNARPMHPDWARSLRDQCVAAGVAFHFKQWGEYVGGVGDPQMFVSLENGMQMAGGKDTHDWGNGYVSQRVGKKAAGRLLDGREWNEFPVPEGEVDV